jgi:hypothetical protein
MLASPNIYAAARSPHGTTSDRPIPQSSSVKKKKAVRHCEFSEKFGILEKHVSNDATENAWFLSILICLPSDHSYMSARKWSLVVNSHQRVAVGHPFLAAGRLKDVPWGTVREYVTPCYDR